MSKKIEHWEEYNEEGLRTRWADSAGYLIIDEFEDGEFKSRKFYFFNSERLSPVTYEESKDISLYEFHSEETNFKAVSIQNPKDVMAAIGNWKAVKKMNEIDKK